MVGDACNLPYLGKFGCVFAGNLICRLPEPGNFYSRLPDLIEPGGLLFITSPYCWLESYTEKVGCEWVGWRLRRGGDHPYGGSDWVERTQNVECSVRSKPYAPGTHDTKVRRSVILFDLHNLSTKLLLYSELVVLIFPSS